MPRGRARLHAGPELALARRVLPTSCVPRLPFALVPTMAALVALTGGVETTPMIIQPDSLQLELVAPARVRPGVPMRFSLRVRNPSERSLDLYLRGRTATLDVVVARVDGDVVWRRLEDEIIPAIVHLRVLKPQEHLDLTATWDQRTRNGSAVAPGQYMARALLLVEGNRSRRHRSGSRSSSDEPADECLRGASALSPRRSARSPARSRRDRRR